MSAARGHALEQALAVFRAPTLLAAVRQRRLPDDLLDLLRIVGGDAGAAAQGAGRHHESVATVSEAAVFFLQQVLFAPGADSYRVLGVNPDADDARIKEHYRWLVRWLHPDRNPDEWDAIYADRVNRAWQDLRQPQRRAAYDRERIVAGGGRGHADANDDRRRTGVEDDWGSGVGPEGPPTSSESPGPTPFAGGPPGQKPFVGGPSGPTPLPRISGDYAAAPLLSGRTTRRLPLFVLGGLGALAGSVLTLLWLAQQPRVPRDAITGAPIADRPVAALEAMEAAANLPPALDEPGPHLPAAGGGFADADALAGAAGNPGADHDATALAGATANLATATPAGTTVTAATIGTAIPATSATNATAATTATTAGNATIASVPTAAIAMRAGTLPSPRVPAPTQRFEPLAEAPVMAAAARAPVTPPAPAPHPPATESVLDNAPAVAAAGVLRPAGGPSDPTASPEAPAQGTLAAITEAEVQSVLDTFSRSYAAGDISGLMRQFTRDARNNRGGRDAIAFDYQNLFDDSESRSLRLRRQGFIARADDATVLARYEATVKHKGAWRGQASRGDIRFELAREDGVLRIREIRHDTE